MASNSFGTLFRITTWGESHGKAMGVVIDGCPAGVEIGDEEIAKALAKRRPGTSSFVSPRDEPDVPQILSGVFEGKTTGAPLSIIVWNRDADSSKYEQMRTVYRPGHANFTYEKKYGIVDYRGGGRSSARETLCRVAAGAIAEKVLERAKIQTFAFLTQIGPVSCSKKLWENGLVKSVDNPLAFLDESKYEEAARVIEEAKTSGDSVGGKVLFYATGIPSGLGDPVYEKLEANLAKIFLSIPASKAFEIGEGVGVSVMKGSDHNDSFVLDNGGIKTETNHSGGVLGGISNGMPLWGHVTFKPTSSIGKPQTSVTVNLEQTNFSLPEGSRHDPCVSVRAVPVVQACLSLVLVDALLMSAIGAVDESKIFSYG